MADLKLSPLAEHARDQFTERTHQAAAQQAIAKNPHIALAAASLAASGVLHTQGVGHGVTVDNSGKSQEVGLV